GPLLSLPCAFLPRSSCRLFLMAAPYSPPRVNKAILSSQTFILEGANEPESCLPPAQIDVCIGSFASGSSQHQARPCPLCPDCDQISHRIEMTRWANSGPIAVTQRLNATCQHVYWRPA